MRGVTIAYLGPEEEAARLAKKGTATDITLLNAKKGDANLNLIHPTRFPEKIQSLLYALDMADDLVLSVTQLDRALGEAVVGAELLGRTRGLLRVAPTVGLDHVQALLAKTALRGLEPAPATEGELREALYGRARPGATEGVPLVAVDHVFPVKGVGTVILGLVRSGQLQRHQTLQLYPTTKTVEIRSIQVHDVDHEAAPTGSRVGCAVKGVEATEVSRGHLLAPPGALRVLAKDAALPLHVDFTPFTKWEPRNNTVLHLFHALQLVVLRVDAVTNATRAGCDLQGRLEAPLALAPNAPAVLVDLDAKAQRFVGRATGLG